MFIDRLISISANSAGLNRYLSQHSNFRLIVPSSKLASYAHGLGFKEVLLYQDLINLEPKVATKSQMALLIILSLQRLAPGMLKQTIKYYQSLSEFYKVSAGWPLEGLSTKYSNLELDLVASCNKFLLEHDLMPEPCGWSASLQNKGIKTFKADHVCFIYSNYSGIANPLLEQLKKLSRVHESFDERIENLKTRLNLHTSRNLIGEMLKVQQLQSAFPNAVLVSQDEQFKRIYSALHKKGGTTLRLLNLLSGIIVKPDACSLRQLLQKPELDFQQLELAFTRKDISNLSSPAEVLALFDLHVAYSQSAPFVELLMKQLALAQTLGADVGFVISQLQGIKSDIIIAEYGTATSALFELMFVENDFLSLVEAIEFPATTFIIQGMNQETWPNIEMVSASLQTLLKKAEVICTRAQHNYQSIFEESLALQNFNLDRFETEPFIGKIPCLQPIPSPPLHMRPTKFSVSAIEMLIRDPYAYYARYMLALYPKEKEQRVSRAFGILLHKVMAIVQGLEIADGLAGFTQKAQLLFEQEIDLISLLPNEKKVIQRKWFNIAPLVYNLLFELATNLSASKLECSIAREIKLASGLAVTLQARADRIDKLNDGSFRIIDFKLASSPAQSDVDSGLFPQLPLEAVIGEFEDASLYYIELNGKTGKLPVNQISYDKVGVLTSLNDLFNMFLSNQNTGYFACLETDMKTTLYKNLSRLTEWRY
jgi:RecB family exonuclease